MKNLVFSRLIEILFLIFSCIVAIIFNDSFFLLLRFIFSQIHTLLLGYSIFKLVKIKFNSSLVFLFLSYALGYSVDIVIYILLLFLGIQSFSLYVSIILFVLSFFVFLSNYLKNVNSYKIQNIFDVLNISVIFFLILLISLFSYLCYNLIPSNGSISINQDLMFWLRNTVAATKGFPLQELSTSGINLYYHYFSSLYLAYIHFVSGIELSNLCFGYSILINSILLVGSVYCFCDQLIKKYKYLAIIIILLTEGFQNVVVVYYLHHLFVGSFGCAEGFSLSLFSFYFFIRLFRNEGQYWRQFFIALLFFGVSLGTKAPIACVVLASIGIGCFFILFNKNSSYKGLVTGLSYLFIFFTVYLVFIQGINNESGVSTQTMGVSLTGTVLSGYMKSVYNFLLDFMKIEVLAYLCCFVCWSIFAHPLLFFLIIFSITLTRKYSYTKEQILLIVAFLVAFLLSVFVSQSGHSQMYFYFSFIPFATVFVFSRFEMLDYSILKQKTVKIVFTLLLTICCFNSIFYLGRYSFIGLKKILKNYESKKNSSGVSVSLLETDALRWFRENTPTDSIFVTNKIFGINGNRSFVTSAFTERQCFIEGSDYTSFPSSISKEERILLVKDVFSGNKESINLLKEKGVDYIVIYESIPYNLNKNECNVVYTNSKISVIEL